MAVGLDVKQLWMEELDVLVNGVAYPKDLSSAMGALSLRMYFSEIHPRPLAADAMPPPSRLHFGIPYGGGGIEYFVARNFSMNLESRWIYSWDHAFTVGSGPEEQGDLSVFQVMLGFRLYLLEMGRNRWRSSAESRDPPAIRARISPPSWPLPTCD